jgi:hypothetical protein
MSEDEIKETNKEAKILEVILILHKNILVYKYCFKKLFKLLLGSKTPKYY